MQGVLSIFKNHKKKTIGLLVLVFIALGSVQIFANKGSKEIIVVTGKVVEDKFEQAVFATGTLEVKDQIDIFTKIAATVEEILVEPGERLEVGQTILKLDSDDVKLKAAEAQAVFDTKKTELVRTQSNLRQAQMEFQLAKEKLARTRTLADMGAVSKIELEEDNLDYLAKEESLKVLNEATLPLVKAQLEEAQVALEQAEKKLAEANIISPISGTLLRLNAEKGHPVQMGMLVASVGNLKSLEIKTGINEVDAADLKVGDLVEISSEGLLEDTYKGHIEYVAPIAELERTSQGEQTQVKIRVAVDEVDNSKLKPGYNVNLKVILAQKDKTILVPYEAVTQRDGQDVVFVVDKEGNVAERPIEIGLSNALFFEVLSGLEKEENVILNPNEGVKEGVKVKSNDRNK